MSKYSKISILCLISGLVLFGCSKEQSNDSDVKIKEAALKPIQKKSNIFKKFGSLQKFEWVPSGYQAGFVYDIYYYIPSSIVDKKDNPALIFMHGGGQSTLTREGANQVVVKSYSAEVIKAAEKYKFIVVLPSTNGLNWGSHTELLLNELAKLLKDNLNFNTNKLGVSGHSMGGMGITRNFNKLVNDFSFVNSISSAMSDVNQTEARLSKMYNITYSHQLGTKDHFTTFIDWTKLLEQNIKNMEQSRQKKSRFEMEWFEDAHVYTANQTKKLEKLFQLNREIFQAELSGQIAFSNRTPIENNIQHVIKGNNRYLWVENLKETEDDSFNFELKAKTNNIEISFLKDQNGNLIIPKSKQFKLYLSSKIFDLNKDILIYIEGKLVSRYLAKMPSTRKPGYIESDDLNTLFEDIHEFHF